MLQLEGDSLRSNGEAVSGIEDRLSSAQDRLSEVNGSYSLAPCETGQRGIRLTRPRAVWYKLAVKGYALTSPLSLSVISCFVERKDVLGVGDRVVNGGNTIKFLNNLEIYPSALYVLNCGRLTGGWTIGNGGFCFKGGHHFVYWYWLVGKAMKCKLKNVVK